MINLRLMTENSSEYEPIHRSYIRAYYNKSVEGRGIQNAALLFGLIACIVGRRKFIWMFSHIYLDVLCSIMALGRINSVWI